MPCLFLYPHGLCKTTMSSPNSKERIWRIAAILAPSRSLPQPEQKVKVHAGAATKATRYGFIDLLRGFALVMMVETHVVNAYLPVALRKGSEFFFGSVLSTGWWRRDSCLPPGSLSCCRAIPNGIIGFTFASLSGSRCAGWGLSLSLLITAILKVSN